MEKITLQPGKYPGWEYMDEFGNLRFKLEVGKFYKTRGGRKALFIGRDKMVGTYNLVFAVQKSFFISNLINTTESGRFCVIKENKNDIVAEWTEENQ